MFTQVSAVISIPLWQWFLQRFGKKTAAFCGITVSILFLFWSSFLNFNALVLVPPYGQTWKCGILFIITETHLRNEISCGG